MISFTSPGITVTTTHYRHSVFASAKHESTRLDSTRVLVVPLCDKMAHPIKLNDVSHHRRLTRERTFSSEDSFIRRCYSNTVLTLLVTIRTVCTRCMNEHDQLYLLYAALLLPKCRRQRLLRLTRRT
jgi:hypothetical protein